MHLFVEEAVGTRVCVFSGLTADSPLYFIPFHGIDTSPPHLEAAPVQSQPFKCQPLPALPPPLPPMNEMVKPDTSGRRREGGLIHASIL